MSKELPTLAAYSTLKDSAIMTRALHVAANAMFLADRRGQIVWINAAFSRLFGFSPEEALGSTPRLLKSGRQSLTFYRELWDTILAGKTWRGRLCNRRKDGEIFDVEQTVTPVYDSDSEVAYFFVIYEDITERLRSEHQLSQLAMFDSLTGLPNRTQFIARLEDALIRARRSGKPLAILMLDLDYFKNVNDTLGHAGGDELLGIVARKMLAVLRKTDTIARLSGDEFAVLIENLEAPTLAFESAQRLIDSVSMPVKVLGASVQIGASIGIATSTARKEPSDILLKNADVALYQAKHHGRGRFHFFDTNMDRATRLRLDAKSAMSEALRDNRFRLLYDPQIEHGTNLIVGAQVRVTWGDSEHSTLSDVEVIELAEQSGRILELSNWILRAAIADISELSVLGTRRIPISIHLSAGQFNRVDLAPLLGELLNERKQPTSALCLNVSESLISRPSPAIQDTLKQLSKLGVHVIFNNFGTGLTSLSTLPKHSIQGIKLGKQTIDSIDKSKDQEKLIKAITLFASALDLDILAEGIERPVQRDILAQYNCRITQGPLHGPSLCLGDLMELVDTAK